MVGASRDAQRDPADGLALSSQKALEPTTATREGAGSPDAYVTATLPPLMEMLGTLPCTF